MHEKSITVSQVHNRNDIHSCVEQFKTPLLKLDSLEKEIVAIPVGWWVTPQDREYIVSQIKAFVQIFKTTIRDR